VSNILGKICCLTSEILKSTQWKGTALPLQTNCWVTMYSCRWLWPSEFNAMVSKNSRNMLKTWKQLIWRLWFRQVNIKG